MVIGGVGPVRVAAGRGRRAGAAGFRVAEGEAVAPGAVAVVGLPSLLAAQEAAQDAGRDREARRHGEAVLAELAALQVGLLRGGDGELAGLAALVRRGPSASDPALAAIQRAVLVRAAVELARRRA